MLSCSTRERDGNSKFQSEKLKGRDDTEDLGPDGKIILEWIIGNGKLWTEYI
jgi:hypothetical protein